MEQYFKEHKSVCHKACYDLYNRNHYERALKRHERKITQSKKKRQSGDDVHEDNEAPPRTRRRSDAVAFGAEICMICGLPGQHDKKHPERSNPLLAAGALATSSKHVKEFTAQIREMAIALNDDKLLTLLDKDVRALERYYHKRCYQSLRNRYRAHIHNMVNNSAESDGAQYAETAAMESVRLYVAHSRDKTFKTSLLEDIYLDKLKDFGVCRSSHTTRFTNKLLSSNIVDVVPVQKDEFCRHSVIKKDSFDDVINSPVEWYEQLRKVLGPVREEIKNSKTEMDLTNLNIIHESGHEIKSIKLRIVLSMLMDGNPRTECLTKPMEMIGQMITMNSKVFYRPSRAAESAENSLNLMRHNRQDEEPLPAALTLKIYSVVRAKGLIQILFHHGICLSYPRVLAFYDELFAATCKLFKLSGGRVIPSILRFGITTVFIDDNLDQNSASLTGTQHFHGSSVTVLQFPTNEEPGMKRIRPNFESLSQQERQVDLMVLDSFTEVPGGNYSVKDATCPIQRTNIPEKLTKEIEECFKKGWKEEMEWASKSAKLIGDNERMGPLLGNMSVSYTKHHLEKSRDKSDKTSAINSVLPLIKSPSNDINFQAHIMNIAIEYTQYLNEKQGTAVGCSDQPLYAWKKKLQWSYPDRFSKNAYFPVMGGMHLEQQLLKINGQLVTGSGLDDVLDQAKLSYIGLKTAFCDVNDIKKALYSVQVVVICLYKQLSLAYMESKSQQDLDTWAEMQSGTMFKYWYSVLRFQITTLMLVRSFRESNLILLLSCLKEAVPLCFALDHIHYSRWLSVFIQDIEELSVENSSLFECLGKNLGVRTSNAEFSRIAYDQKHEMNNKAIKARNGYINLVNAKDASFLRKLEVCSAEVHDLLDDLDDFDRTAKHREESSTFNNTFLVHCNQVFGKMSVNPFRAEKFQMLNSAMVFPALVAQDCLRLFSIGKEQYREFSYTRFVLGSKDVIQTSLKKNNLMIMRNWKLAVAQSLTKIKLSPAELTKLRPACEVRSEAARQLFCQEFTNMPECFVNKEGDAFHGDKADILKVIAPRSTQQPADLSNYADSVVIDLSVIIRSEASVIKTSEYTYVEFAKHILRRLEGMAVRLKAKRLDIVADTYQDDSIKNTTRQARGVGGLVKFNECDLMPEPKKMKEFLQNSSNKIRLNEIIQKYAASPLSWQWSGEVTVTYGRQVWTRSDGIRNIMVWQDNLFEEADNRMVVHVKDAIIENNCKNIHIRTVDTDVVVIMLAFMPHLTDHDKEVNIHIDFGQGDNRRLICLKQSFKSIGNSISNALLFFHAFTGCDSTASFFGKTKSYWFKLLQAYPRQQELIQTFEQLSWRPQLEVIHSSMTEIERFVNHGYGQTNLHSVDESRFTIFTSLVSGNLRELPPTKKSLELHVMRSAYQSGWVWGNTLSQEICPSLTEWGWVCSNGINLQIEWYRRDSISETMTLAKLIKTCKCKKSSTSCKRCNCAKHKFACLKFCGCKQSCTEGTS